MSRKTQEGKTKALVEAIDDDASQRYMAYYFRQGSRAQINSATFYLKEALYDYLDYDTHGDRKEEHKMMLRKRFKRLYNVELESFGKIMERLISDPATCSRFVNQVIIPVYNEANIKFGEPAMQHLAITEAQMDAGANAIKKLRTMMAKHEVDLTLKRLDDKKDEIRLRMEKREKEDNSRSASLLKEFERIYGSIRRHE
jgi:hypothetical protein